jgi:quinol monooxygenase YgiN
MSYVVIATWRAKPGQAERIRKILETVTPGNRAEEKMLQFQAHVRVDDPDTFVLYERYTDASGYTDHRASESFRTHVVEGAIPHLADRDIQVFELID